MNDDDAFLAAIRAAPDDDAPRLVYADWLDENGEPERAEFLRVESTVCAAVPASDQRLSVLDRLRVASLGLDEGWIAAVSRVSIAEIGCRFDEWCDQQWIVTCNWAVVPCPVHVSPTCIEQARPVYPDGADIHLVCHRVAAQYYDELVAKYRTGQVVHKLTEPMRGNWYVLLHLDMLYLDDQQHPVPTRERRPLKVPD